MLFDVSQECFFFRLRFSLISSIRDNHSEKRATGGLFSHTFLNKYTIVTNSFSSVYNCEHLFYSFLHRSAHIWFSYIYNHYSSLWWYIWTQFNNQLPVGLLAQLVARCTGISEVMSSNPVRAWTFLGLISTTTSLVFIAAKISYIGFFTVVHIYFIYLQLFVMYLSK